MKRWFYIGAIVCILLAFFVGFELGEYVAEPGETNILPEMFTQYSLLTWRKGSKDVCFSIMQEYKRGEFLHSWTSKWGAQMWR